MTVKGVLGGMGEPPAQMARRLVEAMPAKLARLFVRLGLLSPEEPPLPTRAQPPKKSAPM